VAACHARLANKPARPRGSGSRRGNNVRAERAHGMVMVRSLRAGWRGDVLTGGSMAASRRQGSTIDLKRVTGGAKQGGGGRGAPEWWADGEVTRTASSGGVQRQG
jgi:hypothetical protein